MVNLLCRYILTIVMSEVKLPVIDPRPVMDPRVPNIRQTKQRSAVRSTCLPAGPSITGP